MDAGGRSMEETRYIISDASKLVDVEQHTLRYWEDELKLGIERSSLGHRLYTEEDISTFQKIKALKEQGFQLKAIKMILPDIDKLETLDPASLLKLKEQMNEDELPEDEETDNNRSELAMGADTNTMDLSTASTDRMGQFRGIMKDIMTDVLRENNVELSDTVAMTVTNSVIKEMDYLMRLKEEREEERYKQFDKTLREYQTSKSHSAASKEKRRKRKLFRNKEQ